MKRNVLVTMLGLTCTMGSAYAMDCAFLTVNLTNTTSNACKLVKQDVKHGYFSFFSSAPSYLKPGDTWGLILQQSAYGPEIQLTYSCGDNTEITFTSQQDYCGFSSGHVMATVDNAKNMTATSQVNEGDWWGAQPGLINWQFSELPSA